MQAMTKIPSIENTEDYIYRFEIKKGTPLHDPDKPNLLVFEQFTEPAGVFHSLDVTIFRDGKRANDIEFRNFEHLRDPHLTRVIFSFCDNTQRVSEHDYLLTIILRYFPST
jgi:hypothetical protein